MGLAAPNHLTDRRTVRNACYIGILVQGNHNVIEGCVAHDNGDTGIHVGGTAQGTQVINCDSYRNYDAEEHGQDADGFGAKFDVGAGTLFRGCRAWNNSDDGYDFWEANANGFKLGRDNQSGSPEGRHVLLGCAAFANAGHGFDENANAAGVLILNCTSWNNGGRNFMFAYSQTATAPTCCATTCPLPVTIRSTTAPRRRATAGSCPP
jgi:parallel beta-helix repeat protein